MRKYFFLLLAATFCLSADGQSTNAANILHQIQKMQTPLRVLYLAAHPDDENTRMIAWLSNDIGAQTAYLSLTRGDGGQNLIGTELGAKLGVLRTQELMQARALDGGQQFFSRAVDFGYSKNPDETFRQWDREQVLSDAVRVIRQFRPHIIITRFPPDARAGHGHHTASAMIALEAFDKAADPQAFPKQNLEAWQVSRVFWNHSSWWDPKIDSLAANDPTYSVVDVGTYLPELGLSCNELASYSRSQHKSQGFGVSVARGSQKEYLKLMKGSVPEGSIFSGLPLTWTDLGHKDIDKALAKMEADFNPRKPYLSVDGISSLIRTIQAKRDPKLESLSEALNQLGADCLGLKLELLAEAEYACPGEKLNFTARMIQRSPLEVSVEDARVSWGKPYSSLRNLVDLPENELLEYPIEIELPRNLSSQPYWLHEPYQSMFTVSNESFIGQPENGPSFFTYVDVKVGETGYLKLKVPARYKFSDRVDGEIERPLMILPELTVAVNTQKLFFQAEGEQTISLDFRAFKAGHYKVQLIAENWKVEPANFELNFDAKNQVLAQTVKISQQGNSQRAQLQILQESQTEERAHQSSMVFPIQTLVEIDYPHIDKRMILEDPNIDLIPMDINIKGERVAYIVGAGDKVPDALVQMGYQVDFLDAQSIRESDLKQYQAIIIGIRAYNTQAWLLDRKEQLLDYVAKGGNLIVQYNTVSRSFQGGDFAPYPFTLSRERVTEEDAAPSFPLKDHPLINYPNKLSDADFEDWVQERGLYFASEWDGNYETPISWHDQGEPARLGGLLFATYGEGAFMYTGISFFRELPAGVTGAYRLLANMISYEHAEQ